MLHSNTIILEIRYIPTYCTGIYHYATVKIIPICFADNTHTHHQGKRCLDANDFY